jgi:hypothetical protein
MSLEACQLLSFFEYYLNVESKQFKVKLLAERKQNCEI